MSFYTEVIVRDPRFHSVEECRDLTLLEPVTRAAVEAIIADAAAEGIVLCVSETYRSPARQKHLFDSRATRLEHVGVHGFGLACDFYKLVNGAASWEGDWTFLRDLANKHGLVSGVDWGNPDAHHSFVDPDHVQRCSVADQQRLFRGEWYPDANYLPPAALQNVK